MERAYDESYRYERIKLSVDILRQVIFRRNKLGKKSLAFSVTELRKLDLSEIDFSGVYMCMSNLSYTNANINPQTAYGKSLFCSENFLVEIIIGNVKKLVKARNART